jgi:hypothetical protein
MNFSFSTPESTRTPIGTKANYANPQTHTKVVVTVHTICLIVVTLGLTLRLYTRKFIVRRLGVDDCMYHNRVPVTDS